MGNNMKDIEEQLRDTKDLLEELYWLVRGECPSLLFEESMCEEPLAMKIEDLLGIKK